jgi:hypothetical protein
MKIAVFPTIILAAGLSPFAIAQTQSQSTTEHTEQHTQTTVNPDGTASHDSQTTHEKTESTANPDGSSTTTQTRQKTTKSRSRTDIPGNVQTTEHHSSSSTTTTTIPPK